MSDNSTFVNLELTAKNLLSDPVNAAKKDTESLVVELTELEQAILDTTNAQKLIAKENELSDSLNSTSKAVDEARENFTELEKAYTEVAAPALEFSKSIAESERELNATNKTYKNTVANLDDVKLSLEKAGVSSRDLVKEQSNLTAKTKLLNGEIAQTDKALKDLSKAKSIEAQFTKDAKAVEKSQKSLDKLKSAVEALDKPNKELNKLIKAQEADLKLATKAYEKSSTSLEKYKTDLSTMGVEIDKISEAESKLTAVRKKSSIEMASLKSSLKEVTDLQKELAKSSDYEKSITDLNAKLITQKKVLSDLKKQYEQTTKPSKELQASYEEAQKSLNGFLAKQDKLKLELAENSNALKRAGLDTDDLTEAEKRLSAQKTALIAKSKLSKKAIDADATAKSRNAANTDLLTQTTRRLAQAYTTIIAAEKAIGAVTNASRQYGNLESAITKVEKTTGTARSEVAGLASELQRLSSDVTPTATNELLQYAEVAGQLGAKSSEDIMNIVTAADALAISTNLAGDEAVTMLSRILSMTDEDIGSEIHNISAVLVELGNNFAATEAEIAHMTKEMVTGTRVIDLSAEASAAFGVTLKESGQAAERSRSAMFEMTQMIKKASVEGGQDLLNLMKVTGLTADAIESNLRDRPEQVLLAFAKGLNTVKVEGGLVSSTLEEFGIKGKEATSVIEILADKHLRLEEALVLANKAYKTGNAHIKEAAQAYADQNSEVSRLINKFIELQAVAGEALGDELQSGITEVNKLVQATTNEVGELVNIFADLGSSVVDLTLRFDGLFTSATKEAGFFKTSLLTIDNTFEALNFTLSAFQGTFDDVINGTNEGMNKAAANVARNQKIILGETSATYEDFKETLTKYSGVLKDLDAEEKKRLDTALKDNQFLQENNRLYSELTQLIIRKSKISEREAVLSEEEIKRNEEKLVQQNKIAEQERINNETLIQLLDEVGNSTEALEHKKTALQYQLEFNIITQEQYQESLSMLELVQVKQTQAAEEAILAQQNAIKETTQLINVTNAMSAEVEDIALAINKESVELNDLQVSLVGVNKESEKYKEVTLEIEKIEERIANQKSEMAVIQEIEGKKLSELTQLKKEHDLVIENLHKQYEKGAITFGEYQKKLDNEKVKTELLSEAVGESTEKIKEKTSSVNELKVAIDRNTNSTEANTISTKNNSFSIIENTEAIRSASTFTSLAAEAQQYLKQEFDYSSTSSSNLSARYEELSQKISNNRKVSSGWYKDIARNFNVGFAREQQVIRETEAFRKYSEQLQSGTISMHNLERIAQAAKNSMKNLSASDLSSLNSAIDTARNKLLSLQDAARSALSSVQDELDLANDNFEAIQLRSAEAKLAELNAQLAEAKASNNIQAQQDLSKAIALTKTLNAQKLETIRLEKAEKTASASPTTTTSTTGTTTSQNATPTASSTQTSTETITFIFKTENKEVSAAVNANDKWDFISLIEESGMTSL